MKIALLTSSVVLALLVVAPAPAIIGGSTDGGNHPYVGAIGGLGPVTPTGVLISPTVFLTAGHVTRMFESAGVTRASVTFDPVVDAPAKWYSGTVHTIASSNVVVGIFVSSLSLSGG